MGDVAIELVTISERKTIYFNNLSFSVSKPEKLDILKNLNGCFNPGRLCAIVGPSGAGKSSLLNILSGFKKPSRDSIFLINGENVSQSVIRKNSAYIAQEIPFLGKLTTKETLDYAAKFKLPTDTTDTAKLKIIDDIVKLLGLEKCLHNQVERLSGGEKKRLAIGEELIMNPPVMIFDEPTSGLDSVSTVQVVRHLMDLAHSGRIVICAIHQLSSFVLELFDDIYVLANGQCIYNGAIADIVPRFQEAGFFCPQYYNRADFVLEVASRQREGNLDLLISIAGQCKQMEQIPLNGIHATETNERTPDGSKDDLQLITSASYTLSRWKQFCILFSRAFLCSRREIIMTQLKLVIHLLLGILFGLTYYKIGNDASKIQSNIANIFMLMMIILTATSMPVAMLFPLEAEVFHREHLNNRYAFFPYFYAKVLSDIPSVLIGTFATMIPIYFLSDQPTEPFRILLVSLILSIFAIKSIFFGLAVGINAGVKLGTFCIPVFSTPMLMYSGFLIRYGELPVYLRPLTYISFLKYYFEAILQAIYGFDREDLWCEGFTCIFKSPVKVIEQMDIVEANLKWGFVAMFIWIVVLKLIAIYGLKRQMRILLK